MNVVDARSHVEIIDREECLRLLAAQDVGRVGFVHGGTPEILPVNFALDGETVVFATAAGGKLDAAERGTITFEVDSLDSTRRSGWSVVIHGFGHEITDFDSPSLVARLRALSLHPWAPGERPHLVRITPRTVTGRRVGPTSNDGRRSS